MRLGPWAFAAAWYPPAPRNSFTEQNLSNGTGGCAVNAYACAGSTSMTTALVDYTFNKYFDVYAGLSYSDDAGGFSAFFGHRAPPMASPTTSRRCPVYE